MDCVETVNEIWEGVVSSVVDRETENIIKEAHT